MGLSKITVYLAAFEIKTASSLLYGQLDFILPKPPGSLQSLPCDKSLGMGSSRGSWLTAQRGA